MATLAALLKHRGLRRQRLGRARLSADERLPGGRRHSGARGLQRRAHRAARSISSSSAMPSRAATRSSKRCSIASCVHARCPRRCATLPVERAVDRDCRHARQDHDDLAGRVAADARRAPTRRCSSAASRATSAPTAPATGWATGAPFVIEGDEYDSAYFDKTAKFLKYLPDIAVVNNIEFDHADIYADLDAVRLAFRRLVNLVPQRGLTLLGADSPDAAALAPLARSRVQTFGTGRGRRLAGGRRRTSIGAAAPRSACCSSGADHGVFTCRCSARTTSATRWPRSPSAPSAASPIDALREGLAQFKGVKRRLEVVGAGARRHRLRRLRASPDGGGRNAARRARAPTRQAHLGHLRAALGIVVPARLPGRLRARVRRRRPGRDRVGVPLDAAGRRSGLSESAAGADLRARGVAARHLPDVDAIVATSPPRRARRRPRRDHVQRRVRRHSPQAARGAVMRIRPCRRHDAAGRVRAR